MTLGGLRRHLILFRFYYTTARRTDALSEDSYLRPDQGRGSGRCHRLVADHDDPAEVIFHVCPAAKDRDARRHSIPLWNCNCETTSADLTSFTPVEVGQRFEVYSMAASHEMHNTPPEHHEETDSADVTRTSSRTEVSDTNGETKNEHERGCIVGGKFRESAQGHPEIERLAAVKEVEFDLPLTLTEVVHKNGEEFVLLKFAKDDRENPFNWSKKKKAFISTLLCLMTLFIGLATTAYSSGIDNMVIDLDASTEEGQLGLFTFNQMCALAPLFLAPFCELVGRRTIYVGAYGAFVIMFIGLALGKNIATILVCRALLGLFGCVGTILVGGTFSDIYDPDERAVPMACFSWVAILGTVAAPIYAGFIDETIGWRWIEGIQGLSNVPLFLIILFCLKETRGGVTLKARAKQLREETGDERYRAAMEIDAKNIKELLYNSSVKSIHMLVTEPVVFAFGLWIAFAWFVTFLFLSVIPITFEEKRGWSVGVAGLPYISLCIGVTLAFALNFLQIRKYRAIMDSRDRYILPESRLYGAMFGAGLLPIGLFIYSFTQYGYLPWIAPTLALAPIAAGIFFIFESTYSFTSDCYGESASSAIAGQGLMRNTLGAVAPLFATQFFHNLGSQWAGLLLALLGTLLTAIPFVMFKYGHILRAKSKLAQTQKGDQQQKEKTGLYTYR